MNNCEKVSFYVCEAYFAWTCIDPCETAFFSPESSNIVLVPMFLQSQTMQQILANTQAGLVKRMCLPRYTLTQVALDMFKQGLL